MQPRSQVDFLAVNTSIRDAARYAIAVGHTRLPVCEPERGLDAPLGMIHAQDLLVATLQHQDTGLQALLRPLDRVPETTPVSEVLNTMRRDRRHMILVAGEHGTTVGLLTLEDLLEELVGEIDDEFDPPTPPQEITHENQRPMLAASALLRGGTQGVTPTDAATAAPCRRCSTLAPPTGRSAPPSARFTPAASRRAALSAPSTRLPVRAKAEAEDLAQAARSAPQVHAIAAPRG